MDVILILTYIFILQMKINDRVGGYLYILSWRGVIGSLEAKRADKVNVACMKQPLTS